MKILLMLFLVLAGSCKIAAPADKEDCVEFNHKTYYKGKAEVCRMVWCEGYTSAGKMSGGIATLWCDGDGPMDLGEGN